MARVVIFQHAGQLFDMDADVHIAANNAGAVVGFKQLNPDPKLNVNTLCDLIVNDLHLREGDYLARLHFIGWELRLTQDARTFFQYQVPFYIYGHEVLGRYIAPILADTQFKGMLTPDLRPEGIYVVDYETDPSKHEVLTYDHTDLSNLFATLRVL